MPWDKPQSSRRRKDSKMQPPSNRNVQSPRRSPRAFEREASPGKNVRFPTNLIMGPYDPRRRSQSPMRSALTRGGQDGPIDDPGRQLQMEYDHADEHDGHELRPRPASPGRRVNARSRGTPETSKVTSPKPQIARQSPAKESNGKISKQPPPSRSRHASVEKVSPESRASTGVTKKSTKGTKVRSASGARSKGQAATNKMDETQSEKRHVKICAGLNELKAMIRDFAESFPRVRKEDVLRSLLVEENEKLVRYVGCLAMGDKTGVEGWRKLLEDTTSRHALVFGILGQALKETVFGQLYFGADPDLLFKLRQKEQNYLQQDGFFRSAEIANEILKCKVDGPLATAMLSHDIAQVTVQLEQLLLPLWNQGSTAQLWTVYKKQQRLVEIVRKAAHLSRKMRMDPSTVYYWPGTFKDEEFDPERMECYNLWKIMTESPYDKQSIHGVDRPILRAGQEDKSEAIVKIICFPGCVAYRQGGGDVARRELAEENTRPDHVPPDVKEHRKKVAKQLGEPEGLTGDEGFRTKVLCKSVVLLEWSKQRLLTKEAGTSVHIDAVKTGSKKYEEDYKGFVDLFDVYLQRNPVRTESQPPSLISSWSRAFSPSTAAYRED